jgi:hypothetical protein
MLTVDSLLLKYVDIPGAKLVLLWEIAHGKVWYAQDLTFSEPTFVAVTLEHQSTWEGTT